MPDFFMKLKENKNQIVAYPIHETWADVGSLKDFSDANQTDNNS
jgi:NDP-sugar pyrophosphorylase family protein